MSELVGMSGETIVVTGGSGFLGASVVREAMGRGDRVVSLIREGEPASGLKGLETRRVDWSDPAGLTALLRDLSPDVVVHCAGSSARSGEMLAALYEANVGLVWRLLSAIADSCAGAGVVILSSAAVYGPLPRTPTREDASLDPRSHYAVTKTLAEGVAAGFARMQGIRVTVARPFNILGPAEPAGSVVAAIADQIACASPEGPVTIRLREAVSVRDFVDVDDVARALLLLGETGVAGCAYNVCTGQDVSVRQLAERAVAVVGRELDLIVDRPDAEPSVSLGCPDLVRALGWEPVVSLDESLRRLLVERRSRITPAAAASSDGV